MDPETGYVIDAKILRDIIRKEVIERFDHRNLNLEVEEFNNLNPTAENIAIVAWNRLRPHINEEFDLSVVLYETALNFVEFNG